MFAEIKALPGSKHAWCRSSALALRSFERARACSSTQRPSKLPRAAAGLLKRELGRAEQAERTVGRALT